MKEVYIISHSHWDREWYMPFENSARDHCLRVLFPTGLSQEQTKLVSEIAVKPFEVITLGSAKKSSHIPGI